MTRREPLKPLDADDPRHGTQNGYGNLGCRCKRCTQAHADYFWVGAGREAVYRYRTESGLLKRRYRMARDARYSPREAMRRSHWSDPLAARDDPEAAA